MIVRTLAAITDTERDVAGPTWRSRRLILADDRAGFSLHDTVIHAGTETAMWYRHHIEAVYCIGGTGILTDSATGASHEISGGSMYLLDQHDRHTLRAHTDMRMVCVFAPACTGAEIHDEDGAYPLSPLAAGTGGTTPGDGEEVP